MLDQKTALREETGMEDRHSDLAEGRGCFLRDEEFFVFMMGRLRSVSATVETIRKEEGRSDHRGDRKEIGAVWGGEQSLGKSEKQSLRHCRVQVLAPSEPGL